ncbi:AAA family ATPase [Actinomyces sp. zg-332]|uniref:ATP-dependent Clp protease ATP-binding subunit n=1 Tax=Actinomyces sp. zg-332 TaxID=2708340 RepID=UPI001423DA02|nr:AAA family ATPase [Actinomyces sp. zg-332]QPK94369.1 AAA family ATPase [Actinomyces sp. zg-332]
MTQKLTVKSQEALVAAIQTASAANNPQAEPLHLLQALLEQTDGIAVSLLSSLNVDVQAIGRNIRQELVNLPTATGNTSSSQPSKEFLEILDNAGKEASENGDEYTSTEHLLIAILQSKTKASKILKTYKVELNALRENLKIMRGNTKITTANPENTFQALEKYSTDLTEVARSGKLDPIIGRDSQIRRLIQVLSRRTKNNPVLIGEPGVGKTAVVEGLAQRIVAGDVPDSLKNRKLVSLDLTAMVAGASYRGEFEERLQAVLNEITNSDGQIITFIDELHNVVGTGANSEGSMDASNMLKPMLARGELHLIGATTLDEYRQYIEKDPALERRFQQVYVSEPSVEDTIAILRGIAPKYEAHHKITIADSALVSAATLSDRYISGRQLPDKAIDLIDEAASRLRMELDSSPVEIDNLRRTIDRLKIEETYLSQTENNDEASKERLDKLLEEIAGKSAQLAELESKWETQKHSRNQIGDLRVKLDELRTQLDLAMRDGNLELAGRLQNWQIPAIEREIEATEIHEQENEVADEELLVAEKVGPVQIAEVIEDWTGIPTGKLLAGEMQKLLNMEDEIARRLVGQTKAVSAVADAVRRSRAGISDPDRPTGSFMFLGPTGVGKTELAKSLAQFLFDDEHAMVRIDMSEYSDKHSVSRLVGSPPGYVGYEEGGQLTEAVRRRPYSVILLDEVEKAHPEIFNIFLQVLDDGRLTDGQGRTVDFTNTILILTSNLGTPIIIDEQIPEEKKPDAIMQIVQANFKPEFLNRLDEVLIFEPLSQEDLSRIVDLQLQKIMDRLKSRRIKIKVDDKAKQFLIARGYDKAYGARPLKRLIQKEIGDKLAKEILSNTVKDGDSLDISYREESDSLEITSNN